MDVLKLIATVTPILLAIIGAATAYLRMFIRSELAELRLAIIQANREEFVSKEVFEAAETAADRRFTRLEGASVRR